jgi:RNA polymerase sigma-70 factor (ECF subfamily)
MHLPEGHSSERELIEALRHPKTREAAFRSLVRAWHGPLYGHLRRMLGNHDDAADCLQDSFLKVAQNLDSFRGDSALYSWVHSIANRAALDALRKRQRDRLRWGDTALGSSEVSEQGAAQHHDIEDPNAWNAWHGHDSWDEGEALHAFMEAVNNLPDRQRAVFVLRYFEAMPYAQMAQSMGVTESTLKALHHHAKSKLMAALT